MVHGRQRGAAADGVQQFYIYVHVASHLGSIRVTVKTYPYMRTPIQAVTVIRACLPGKILGLVTLFSRPQATSEPAAGAIVMAMADSRRLNESSLGSPSGVPRVGKGGAQISVTRCSHRVKSTPIVSAMPELVGRLASLPPRGLWA